MPAKNFFPTSLWSAALGSASSRLNRDLLDEAYKFRKIDEAGRRWSRENYFGGYTSYSSISDLPFRSSTFEQLKRKIDPQVKAFARYLDMELGRGKLEMKSCWINIMGGGCHHSFHLHPLSAISGTYFVQVPKGGGALKIEDPRMAAFMGSPPRSAKAQERNARFVSISPKAGQVLLFESWLRHEVPANQGADERVSISFNYDWV